jgi:hypothetical protein
MPGASSRKQRGGERKMTSGEKKFIIWFALILLLWRIVEAPAVQSAFLQFLAVGQVPGTDMTLSPKGVFLVIATVFSLSLIAIFWSNLKQSFNKRRHSHARHQERSAIDQPVLLSKPRPFAAAQIPAPKLDINDKKLPLLYVPSMRPFLQKVRNLFKKTGVIARKAVAAEYDSLKTIFTFMWKVIVFVSMALWRFAEPRFRKFDKWLERKAHKNHVTSEILEILEECWRAVVTDRRKTDKIEEA